MFDVELFSEILQKISNSYSSKTEFSEKSGVNRTYLSKYINKKLNQPPTPKILEKIAISSHGIVSYADLMEVCGYLKTVNRLEIKKEEYNKNIKNILSKNFAQNELQIIEDYLLSDSSVSNYEKKFNEYENFVYSLDDDRKNLLLEITSKFLLNVSKNFLNNANETRSIFDKSQDLLDKTDIPSHKFYMCPVYGKISAGVPNWAEECLEGYLPIDPNLMGIINPEECMFLLVNGESMNKVIRNGAYALIRKQDMVENGEIAAVLVNGFEATLKKFSKQGDLVILEPMSDDSSFTTQVYGKDTEIRILGKYIGKFEMNK